MKRYNYIFLLFASIVISSCNAMLEETPQSQLSPENLFQTQQDAEMAVLGMYEGFIISGLVDDEGAAKGNWKVLFPVYGWGEMGTDIWSIITNSTSEQAKFSKYTLTAADQQVADNWADYYKIINRANIVIERVNDVDGTEEAKKQFMAEAKFVRAFCYMDLVQFYGRVPLKTTPTNTLEESLSTPRSSSEGDVWDLIIKDLEESKNDLPSENTGRATEWAAKTLLAKAYLTRGCNMGAYDQPVAYFDSAAINAYDVIANSGKTLNTTTKGSPGAFKEYGKQFLVSGENSPESLFEIQFLEADYGGAWGYRSIKGGQKWDNSEYGDYYYMWGGTMISSEFALSFHDTDIRFSWSIGPYSIGDDGRKAASLTQWMPGKFRWETTPGGSWESSMNAPVMRMAEAYLIFAEASNEVTGSPSNSQYGMSAFDAINIVRDRAQVPLMDLAYLEATSPYTVNSLNYNFSYESVDTTNANYIIAQQDSLLANRHVFYSGGSKEKFRSAVLMERAWELCFERHRWFDLKRTGNLITFNKRATVSGAGILSEVTDPISKTNFSNKPANDKRYWDGSAITEKNLYLPIPDVEIQINPSISQGDQNSGY